MSGPVRGETGWGTLGEPSDKAPARINLQIELPSTTLRHVTYDAGAHVPMHRHGLASLVYGVGGPCIESGPLGKAATRRRLTFLPVGHEHALDYVGPTQVLAVEAQPELAERLRLTSVDRPVALPASMYDDVWSVLIELRGMRASEEAADAVAVLWSKCSDVLHARLPAWLPDVITRLHDSWQAQPSATAIAAELGFSPQFLCRSFKSATGLTMRQYVQAIRLDYARGLLWGSGKEIAEVASITGFSDQSHLTRTLRQHSGETPRRFRSSSFAPSVSLRHSR